MAAGVILGQLVPQVPTLLRQLEFANISIPMTMLIWLMIYPMMMKVDFKSVKYLEERTGIIPGAACARWGVCGAAASCGMAFAIAAENAPLKVEGWSEGQTMVSDILAKIAASGAPRCCKRDSRIAAHEAVPWFNHYFGTHLEQLRENPATMASANISSVVNAMPKPPEENQLECTDPAANDAAYTAQPTPKTTWYILDDAGYKKKTAWMGKINPHTPQHGEQKCTTCHKAHRASVNYCSQCHTDAVVPDGWLSYTDSKLLEEAAGVTDEQ